MDRLAGCNLLLREHCSSMAEYKQWELEKVGELYQNQGKEIIPGPRNFLRYNELYPSSCQIFKTEKRIENRTINTRFPLSIKNFDFRFFFIKLESLIPNP